MKLYLSSYKIGGPNEVNSLKSMLTENKKTAYISNALDFSNDVGRRKLSEEPDIQDLTDIGLDVEIVDLRKYFHNQGQLSKDLNKFGVIWARGGNAFVLRQAMYLSGFDKFLSKMIENNEDKIYGGYSAGVCILGPTLKGLELVDNLEIKPYKELQD
jgi:dipeptidase E